MGNRENNSPHCWLLSVFTQPRASSPIRHVVNEVEHPEAIAQRIGRFANVVGRENVIAGADCGFASFSTTCEVHPTVVWAKLEALAEGARLATKELWGRA